MKKIVFWALVFALFPLALHAQAQIEFSSVRHNYGTIKEDGGVQVYDFVFVNKGNSPLIITRVVPSIRNVTPNWTREAVPPGGAGFVRSSMNPMNMPGAFTNTVTVHSNGTPTPVVLTLTGNVTPRERTIEEQFRWALGELRFESNHMAFSRLGKNEKKTESMPLINTSDEPLTVAFEWLPKHLSLKVTPATIAPGKQAVLEGTYDATQNSNWGIANDLIRISINGVVDNSAFLYITATLIEDFSEWSSEQIANAAVITFDSTTFDFGKMPVNESKPIEFKYTNTGKSDLHIRHIRATCGCTALQEGNMVIKPGESSVIKATFTSGALPGVQQRNIFIYTNDPKNPEIMLMIRGEVIKEGI